MTPMRRLQRVVRRPIEFARSLHQKAGALVEGSANQSRLINDKSNAIIQGLSNQSRMLNNKLDAVIVALDNQSRLLTTKLDAIIAALEGRPRLHDSSPQIVSDPAANSTTVTAVRDVIHAAEAQSAAPLVIAEKTYNTSHPDYDANIVHNFPGRIINNAQRCENTVYLELKKLAKGDHVPDGAWAPVLENAFSEAKTIPHAELVLHRREAIEQHMAELECRYNARYIAGWVNVDDALFLYWLVRNLKPKTIVQCGVCNGLSSAFMILALVKNGSDGQLHAIDIPPVFNPKDPAWTIPGKTYGMVIPEGKNSGWMVPEVYRKQFRVQSGDAKQLLPKLVDQLSSIDMFYHDSDHTYNHMAFEFRQARRKLNPGGLVVADDISWNAALWDFADEQAVPAYNFKGSVGVAFF